MGTEPGRIAREELWRRYDAGALTASELDARLARVDRAGDDPTALAAALDGPAGRAHDLGTNRSLMIGAIAVAVAVFLLSSLAWLVRDGDDDDGGTRTTGGTVGAEPVPLPAPLPLPPGVDPAADCPEADDAVAALPDGSEPAANPALLSDPPALPEGYDVAEEDTIGAGTDPNIAMSVNAGTPAPVEILARDLGGELLVTMRAFRYESADAATQAAVGVTRAAVCSYDLESFVVPDRPEITGTMVGEVIPLTAFAGFRLGDRRFTVAVQVGDDGGDGAPERARQLAGLIAAMELDAARTPPPD